jgi:hypothetical protein
MACCLRPSSASDSDGTIDCPLDRTHSSRWFIFMSVLTRDSARPRLPRPNWTGLFFFAWTRARVCVCVRARGRGEGITLSVPTAGVDRCKVADRLESSKFHPDPSKPRPHAPDGRESSRSLRE